jgi:hypothetical protein
MNFVIGNYASATQTEPMYIDATLKAIGCKSAIWNPTKISAYDIFDMVKPDYHLTHITAIMTDVVSYIKENGGVELIINISGANQDVVTNTERLLKERNVPIAFLFTNSDDCSIESEARLIKIGFGADLFLSKGNIPYNLDLGQIVFSKEHIKSFDCPYHTISYVKSLENDVDILLPVNQLSNIYHNYDRLVFRSFGAIIPQCLYDAIYYGKHVSYDIDDEDTRKVVSEKIKKIFRTDMDICDPNNVDSVELRKQLLDRHTCFHRVKSILSQLPSSEYLSKIDQLIGEVK